MEKLPPEVGAGYWMARRWTSLRRENEWACDETEAGKWGAVHEAIRARNMAGDLLLGDPALYEERLANLRHACSTWPQLSLAWEPFLTAFEMYLEERR